MTSTPDAAPSGAAVDPQDFPPHTLNPDQAQAVRGRLSDVDPEFAPPGSDQEAQASPRPPELADGADYDEEVEAAAAAKKQENIDAGAAGSGDDTTGRVVKVPEPDGGLEDISELSSDGGESAGRGRVKSSKPKPSDGDDDKSEDEVEALTVAELQAELESKEIEYDKYARKPELVDQVRAARGC